MKNVWRLLAVVCVLVVGLYAYLAQFGELESLNLNAADATYNLLVQGLRAGQLSLKKEAPPGLAQLADPYDPAANILYRTWRYRMNDLSYYKGRLYLYFGITPALILFWPFAALTGEYLFQNQAVVIFCAIGFLVSVGLMHALWRRYFADVSPWVVAACALALGLAAGVLMILPRSEVYEVAISCGYMLAMLALAAIWRALHERERAWRWLAAASAAYGLAVGARPSLLLGAVILLVPVAQAWRERRPRQLSGLIAATVPITLVGLGLMLYNVRRFGSPFDFGRQYQLAGHGLFAEQSFSLRYLWFNFRVYFLAPAGWSARFPFVHEIAALPLPTGHVVVEKPFGVLTNIPVVWLALAAPLAWRNQPGPVASILRWFVTAMVLLFGMCALPLGFFENAALRYEVDFLPVLVLLAVVGILGLERVLADRPTLRRAVRCGWGSLLAFSVAFNLLASLDCYAMAHNVLGLDLGLSGRTPEAIIQFEQAVRIRPDFAEAHNNLAVALSHMGRVPEAIEQFQESVRIKPADAEAHNNLGIALAQVGRLPEAVTEFEQALRVDPDYARAHNSLGLVFAQQGRLPEAINHWEQAVRIRPDYAEAHENLGKALEQTGRTGEARAHFEQALRIDPNLTEARDALVRLQAHRPAP
jgi:tetratricopeptide (TPR) repeat protein